MTLILTVVTGLIYPLVMTGLANLLFPDQSGGSLVVRDGTVIGSALIGQNFTGAGYFHPRPSAAGDRGYDPMSSGGSNFGPIDRRLIDRVKATVGAASQAGRARTHSGGSGHRFGQRARSGHHACRRRIPGRAGGTCTRADRGPGAAARSRLHGGPPVRRPRRAAGERFTAQPGAGRIQQSAPASPGGERLKVSRRKPSSEGLRVAPRFGAHAQQSGPPNRIANASRRWLTPNTSGLPLTRAGLSGVVRTPGSSGRGTGSVPQHASACVAPSSSGCHHSALASKEEVLLATDRRQARPLLAVAWSGWFGLTAPGVSR